MQKVAKEWSVGYGVDDLDDDNEVPQKADEMNHSEVLNSIETALA
jgi:hypothetical protein